MMTLTLFYKKEHYNNEDKKMMTLTLFYKKEIVTVELTTFLNIS